MSYKLWIDDQAYDKEVEDWRRPPVGETDWKIATNSCSALICVMAHGIPEFIDFDHDLGENIGTGVPVPETVMEFLHYLFDMYPEAIDEIKDYRIHSANPEGAKNIHAYMDSWKRSRSLP